MRVPEFLCSSVDGHMDGLWFGGCNEQYSHGYSFTCSLVYSTHISQRYMPKTGIAENVLNSLCSIIFW